MADELVQSLIKINFDAASGNITLQGIENIKDELAGLATQAQETALPFDDLAKSIRKAGGAGGSAGGGGSVGTSARRTLGALGGIANRIAPGAGTAFGLAGDVTEIAKDFPKIKEALSGVGSAAAIATPAIIALVVGIKLFAKTLTDAQEALKTAIDADNKYYQNVSTMTTKQVQEQITALNRRNDAIKDQILKETKIVEAGKQAILNEFSGIFDALGLVFGKNFETIAKSLTSGVLVGDLQSNVDKLNQEFAANSDLMAEDTQGLKENAFAANDAAVALKQVTEQLYQFSQDSINSEVDTNKKILELKRSGSEQQLNDAIQSTKDEITATKQKIDAEYKLATQYENEPEIYGKISEEITKLQKHQTDLQGSLNALSDATLRGYTISNDIARKQKETQDAIVSTYEKYQSDVLNITTKYNEDSAALEQKRADKLEAIQQQAVDDAQKLLTNLQTKDADLARGLTQGLTDIQAKAQQTQLQEQIGFQRQQVQAEKKYQDDITRIRQQAQENEFELSLDRDFAGLARSRRQTANQINDVTKQANDDRQARLDAYRQKQQDDQVSFINERQQRITQYQRNLEDANIQYQRESRLQAQNAARQRDAAVADFNAQNAQLTANYRKQLDIQYQAAQSEIKLAQQTASVRLQTYTAEYQAALKIFSLVTNGVSGGSTGAGGGGTLRGRAFGGSLAAFSASQVNEPGSSGLESFSSGGKSALFPANTAGVFIPFQSGTVDKNTGGQSVTVNAPITVNGAGQSPEKVAEMVEQKLETTIRKIFVNKAS